jgi:hypothetical protein
MHLRDDCPSVECSVCSHIDVSSVRAVTRYHRKIQAHLDLLRGPRIEIYRLDWLKEGDVRLPSTV